MTEQNRIFQITKRNFRFLLCFGDIHHLFLLVSLNVVQHLKYVGRLEIKTRYSDKARMYV